MGKWGKVPSQLQPTIVIAKEKASKQVINQNVKTTNHYICHSPNSKEKMIDD